MRAYIIEASYFKHMFGDDFDLDYYYSDDFYRDEETKGERAKKYIDNKDVIFENWYPFSDAFKEHYENLDKTLLEMKWKNSDYEDYDDFIDSLYPSHFQF